jgi:hypothetical protein
MENSPRSWSFDDAGAWRKTAPDIDITVWNPSTSE